LVAPGDDRDHAGLGSADDVRLERLLEDLHATATTLALSLKALSRSPDNPVYRASAEQQAQVGREQVLEVLRFEAVAHSDEAAAEAVRGIEAFFELAEQLGAERARAQVAELFQGVVATLFDETGPGGHERPCETLCELLATWVELPEPPPAPEAPVAPPAQPQVLFEQTFTHEDAGAAKPWLPGLLMAVLQLVRGLSREDAASSLHAQSLIGFDQSLQKALGDYRGPVTLRILSDGDNAPRIELLRRVSPSVG